MALPVVETFIGTLPNTKAWRYNEDGSLRLVTAKGGVDLCVRLVQGLKLRLRLYMKEGDRIWDVLVLNTFVPYGMPIEPVVNHPNRYVFKDWSATEPGRKPGKRDVIMIELDSLGNTFRCFSYFSLATNQDMMRALFQSSQQQLRRGHEEVEEEEVVGDVVIDDDDDDDDKSVDLLGDDDAVDATDDDEDTLGTLTDINVRHDDADDDDSDDEHEGHLGFADCSQQHTFSGMSNLRL